MQPPVDHALIALTIPDKPTRKNQHYILTALGKRLLQKTKAGLK